jgi:uncharacterized protein
VVRKWGPSGAEPIRGRAAADSARHALSLRRRGTAARAPRAAGPAGGGTDPDDGSLSVRPVSLRRSGRRASTATANIYYASDVHGSERLWRKFLKAGDFYGVDTLIMGGDLVGKAIVPVVRSEGGRHEARFLGECRVASTPAELESLLDSIRFNGMYPWVADREEVSTHSTDEELRRVLFDRVIAEEMRRWVGLADERLAGSAVTAYVIAGNDDPWFVDPILGDSKWLVACDDSIVMLGEHELLSSSYANKTPWDSHRELDEDALYVRLKSLADQLERPESAIFNLHVPPFDSGLDLATKIDGEFKVVLEGGATTEVPVGSRAVRQLIEEFQPLLALHGHIHESRGHTMIGRTLAVNSGSEYNTGRLHGAVIRIQHDKVLSHQFVVG